jgi:PLP dependent protein
MTAIAANLQAVRDRIARAARAAQRSPGDVVLLAVSKTIPAERIAQAHAAGQRAFGENTAQEAVEKITNLATLRPAPEWHVAPSHRENSRSRSDMGPSAGVASPEGPLLLPLEWHFIGPIQSNKTGPIAAHFQWVHSVERARIAERLNAARPDGLPPLNVCIQVNVSGEATKSGVAPGGEVELAGIVSRLSRLKLRGLMAIPEPTPDVALQRRRFALLRELKDGLVARGHALDTLSMGMSDDFEAAIAEGATIVRIGTAIFGPRQKP